MDVFLVVEDGMEYNLVLAVFSSRGDALAFINSVLFYKLGVPAFPDIPPNLPDESPLWAPYKRAEKKRINFMKRCPGGIAACQAGDMRIEPHQLDKFRPAGTALTGKTSSP